MTEAEWLACDDPSLAAAFLWEWASDRKRRLLAVAACRRMGPLLTGGVRDIISGIEIYLDRPKRVALTLASESYFVSLTGDEIVKQLPARKRLARWLQAAGVDEIGHIFALVIESTAEASRRDERHHLCGLLRDVVGNPFRPLVDLPGPLSRPVMLLAEAAYENRDSDSGHLDQPRLAVLTDALEECGCTDTDALVHLRSPGPHVRGCWALDLVLGES
ncbi:MAG: hypothetical protein ACRC33_10875 [Gemmataceae bacterium]